MRKGKRGPPLFELLKDEPSTKTESLRVPDWWSRRGSGPLPDLEADASTQDEDPLQAGGPRLAAAQPERTIELAGERIHFSLTSTGAALALFAVLVVLLGAFELGAMRGEANGLLAGYEQGRASYTAEVVGDIESARAQPANTALVRSLLSESNGIVRTRGTGESNVPEMEDAGSAAATWVRGHTYIVAQEFSAGREQDAMAAQAFLWQAGIRAKLVEIAGGALQLITAQGYNHRDPAQRRTLEKVLERLHARGAEYYAQGGGYRLKGYLKTLKSDTW